MAVSQDDWNGALTRFLDKLPLRPCIVPPAPSFCTVCGRLNHHVASACKFYPLRFEREMGRTTIEPAGFMGRRDTFEIDAGYDEEEEEQELLDAPMIEFERPVRVPVSLVAPAATTIPADFSSPSTKTASTMEAEIEVVEAELVEVIEEPAEEPVRERTAEGEAIAPATPPAPLVTESVKEEQLVPPEKMTVIAPIYHQPKLKIIVEEKPPVKAEELPLPPPPPDYKGPIPAAAMNGEMEQETPAAKTEIPPVPEKPVETEAVMPPSPPEILPSIPETPPEKPMPPVENEKTPPETPEKAPPSKPEAPGPENALPVPPPPPTPTTGRRTGGLYDIFRRKPVEPKKEAPNKIKDEKKKKEDEELLKKLKTIEK
jgi:hypothetical protein